MSGHNLSLFYLFVGSLLLCSTVSADLIPKSNLVYEDSSEGCNFDTEPCAPLNDVWGFQTGGKDYAVVGVSNGVDFVDVTDPTNPRQVNWPYRGCLTEWRDIKRYDDVIFIVNDHTYLCDCSEEQQPCQQLLTISYSNTTMNFDAHQGVAQAPLTNFPNGVSGETVYLVDNPLVCDPISGDVDVSGKVVLVDRGDCEFTVKTRNVQDAGGIAIVVVNERDDVIYPSMYGDNTGITIPGMMIGNSDGYVIKSLLEDGQVVTSILNATNKAYSDLYQGPDGLVIMNITDPTMTYGWQFNYEFFNFAHNIVVDPDRALLYTCGQDSDIGGVLVLDISSPFNPVLIATFDAAYIHDIEVVYRADVGYTLYGAAIYNSTVYVIDVNDPYEDSDLNSKIITSFSTIDMPHNTAATWDDSTLYVTHEADAHPITIWSVADLDNIYQLGEISYGTERNTIPHNAFVNEDILWTSYYSEGVMAYDISEDPAEPRMIGHYDTSPYDTGFHGVWGIYPYFPENINITYASDIESGLWVLELDNYTITNPGGSSTKPDSNSLLWLWITISVIVGVVILVAVLIFAAAVGYKKWKSTPSIAPYDPNSVEEDENYYDDM